MAILFLLPDIHERQTGGNVYNREMIDALRTYERVETAVYGVDTFEAEAFRVVVADSLLVDRVEPAAGRWFLMVHYLPMCDPRVEHAPLNLDRLGRYDGFITTSQFSADCLIGAGIDPVQVHVVYPGLDAAYRNGVSREPAGGPCRLLTVASLLPGKGLIEGVEVLEGLVDLAWTWTLVGDDGLDEAYAARLRERIAASPIRDRVMLQRPIPAAQMPEEYRRHDVFVSFSLFETLGMAIREAMACGLAVAVYDVGGVSESFADRGWEPAANETELMRQLAQVIASTDDRKRLGRYGMESAQAFPSWEASAWQFYSLTRID